MTLNEAIKIAEQEESKISYRLECAYKVVARPYQEMMRDMYLWAIRAMQAFSVQDVAKAAIARMHLLEDEVARLRAVESEYAAWREHKIGVSEHLALREENKRLKSDAANYQQVKSILSREGFSDIETMIIRYKQVMHDANEISIARDEELESLRAQFAQREKENADRKHSSIEEHEEVHYWRDRAKTAEAQLAEARARERNTAKDLTDSGSLYMSGHRDD